MRTLSQKVAWILFGPLGGVGVGGAMWAVAEMAASRSNVPSGHLLAAAIGLQLYVAVMAVALSLEGSQAGPLITADRRVRVLAGAVPSFACALLLPISVRPIGALPLVLVLLNGIVGAIFLAPKTSDLHRAVMWVGFTALALYVTFLTLRPLDVLFTTFATIIAIRFVRAVWRDTHIGRANQLR